MALLGILIGCGLGGEQLRRALSLDSSLESRLLGFFGAIAILAPLAVLVASFSILLAQSIVFLAALGLLLARFRPGGITAGDSRPLCAPQSSMEWICTLATAAALLLALIGALAPATSWDAAVAHLALPHAYARSGHIGLEPGNVYSGYPHLLHTLFALAYYPGFERPAALLNWFLAAAGCLSVFALGARIHDRAAGFIAMAIFATAPIFMDQAGAISIDLPFAAFTAMALCAIAAWHDTGKRQYLVAAGLLAGASCGMRHTGYLSSVLLGAGIIILSFKRRDTFSKTLPPYVVFTVLAAAPWSLRSGIVVGNPVFPFLSAWFPGAALEHVDISRLNAHESLGRGGGTSILGLLRFPWDIVMRPAQYDGWTKSPGGLVLALGLPGIIVGGARARALGGFSIAGGVAFFFFQRFARYLLPFFVPMMVVAAVASIRLKPLRYVVVPVLILSFAWGLALDAASISFKVSVVLGMVTREEYLKQRVERYPAFAYANRYLNDGGTILTIDQRSYYLAGPSYQNHWALKRVAHLPYPEQLAWLRANKIKHVMIPWDFLEESPAIREDLQPMLRAWADDRSHFRKVEELHLPKPGDAGLERVAFYDVTD